MDNYLSVNDASSILGISPHGVRKLIHEGKLKSQRRGGLYFVHMDSIEKYRQYRSIHRIGMSKVFSNAFVEKPVVNQYNESLKNFSIPNLIEKVEMCFEGDMIMYMSYFGRPTSIMVPNDCMQFDDLLNLMESKYPGEGGKKFKKILLYISSPGGILEASIKFIDIIRQYSNTYEVIVPYMAKSAASLICLASDRINMTTISELGPIDPIIENPSMPGNMIPAKAIDDFISYYSNLVGNGGVISSALLKIFENKIDPYILGSWKSALGYSQEEIRKALKGKIDDDSLENAIKSFTIDNVSHNHPITYRVLKDLGIKNVEQIPNGEALNNVKMLFKVCNDYMYKNNIAKTFRSRSGFYDLVG